MSGVCVASAYCTSVNNLLRWRLQLQLLTPLAGEGRLSSDWSGCSRRFDCPQAPGLLQAYSSGSHDPFRWLRITSSGKVCWARNFPVECTSENK